MKNKWTAAAVIALASGSVVLFAPTGKAQAAEADAGVKTEQVETNKQTDQAQQKQVKQPTQGEDIAVAVIDSGADPSHKDFQTAPTNPKFSKEDMEKIIKKLGHGRYVSPKFPYVHNMITGDDDQIKENNQDAVKDGSHGQHVSGIIAANGQPDNKNGEYVVGVAPEAQLLFLKYFSDDGTTGDVAEAIYDAVNAGADVIALSLNSAPNVPNLNNADQRAIRYAVDHGVVISVSASNDGNSASIDASNNVSDKDDYYPNSNLGNYKPFNSGDIGDPADSPDAITVAAEKSEQDEDSDMADFTSWGSLPDYTLKSDVSAPGVDIISTGNDNKYVKMDGTSMATPFNSGVAALVIQRLKKTNPNLHQCH